MTYTKLNQNPVYKTDYMEQGKDARDLNASHVTYSLRYVYL
jgi:hypothetical protein